MPTPTPTPTPQASILLNGSSFKPKSLLTAIFKLDSSIQRSFTAYAVIIMPGGKMLNAGNLSSALGPVATNMPGLNAPFSSQFMSSKIPKKWQKGSYEVLVAFFDPLKPITARGDAFLQVSAKFTIQ